VGILKLVGLTERVGLHKALGGVEGIDGGRDVEIAYGIDTELLFPSIIPTVVDALMAMEEELP